MRIKTITPTEELSISQRSDFRLAAIAQGKEHAIARGLATRESAERILCARPVQNIADFGTAADAWLTGALLVAGTAYTVFNNIAAPAVPANRVFVFYKVGVETVPLPVSLLNFRQGAGGGTTYAQFDLEQLVNCQAVDGYFSEPIVYEPTEVMLVQVVCRAPATGVAARVQLGCYVIEALGATISA